MSLEPGRELHIRRYVSLYSSNTDISNLIAFSAQELEAMKAESIQKEKAIFEKLEKTTDEWEAQGRETKRLVQALEYVKTRPVEHTSNAWTVNEYGRHIRSNMVYEMTWSISENSQWDRAAQKNVIYSWSVTWSLHYNTSHNTDYTGSGWEIAGQNRKRYGDKAELDKYLQGRINAYAHLFTEISPPIPQDQVKRFCVNGSLLPGYTVERPMEPDKEAVDALLSLLDDEDLLPSQPEAPTVEQEQTLPQKENKIHFPAKKRSPAPAKRNTAPIR